MSKRSGRGRNRSQGPTARGQSATAGRQAYTSPPPLPKAPVGKAGTWRSAPRTPSAIETSLSQAGMDGAPAFGPGRPLNPYQGYSQPTRAMDYPVSVNISTRTRASWGLPSFDTLRAIIKAYDVARMCINHKIDELRSMEPMFVPAEGVRGDVADAVDAARTVLEYPDRDLPYEDWLSKWLENAFKFDAAPLYRRRNLDGDVIGLEVVDGTTIMPYIDERGRKPLAPAPAYYQLIHGQPWNWYTRQDIDYRMFRPQEDAPFGTAPIETILLTANTDIRFQWHFLQMFTEGSVPAGFIEVPPDVSSPDQVGEWQDYWDAMVMGDQAKLHQLIAVPSGTKVTNTRPESFDSGFSEYLMSRTCAAFGVVPQDIGLVKDVNRANGETQTDIQFRVNTLPWVFWVEKTLSRYLRRDIGLPVQVKLNTGRDKEDRKADAEAWKIYVESGAASPDEMRSELLGLPVDNDRPTPRFFNNARLGPIPLLSIEAVSGKTDPETHGPAADQPPLDQPYVGPVGVIPEVGTTDAQAALAGVDAEQQQHRSELNAEHATAPGPQLTVAKRAADEMAAFRRYAKGRQARGRWRDFQFTHLTDPVTAHRLNDAGRAAVRKAVGAPVAAGLAVRARDTGRVLMLQRGLDPITCPCGMPLAYGLDGGDWWSHADGSISHDKPFGDQSVSDLVGGQPPDPAAGTWEFPGGCIGDGEAPLAAAVREWQEETGIRLAVGDPAAQWVSPDGVYYGFVVDVLAEDDVPIFDGRGSVTNPDDPDGDTVEAIAWWDPQQLPGNPAVRAELAAGIDCVLDALGADEVAKAGGVGPKDPGSATQWPGWDRDLDTAAHYAAALREALSAAIAPDAVAGRWLAAGVRKAAADPNDPGWRAARQWLIDNGYLTAAVDALQDVLTGAYTEGFVIGDRSAVGVSTRTAVDWGGWTPGDVDAANLILGQDGMGAGLQQLLNAADVRIKSLGQGRMDDLARALALSLDRGDSSDTLARDLRDILDDASWADMVATTEIARAVTASTIQSYAATGIEYVSWASAEDGRVCSYCQQNEDAGAIPLGNAFPSGDDGPPGHPRCRCCLLAEVMSDSGVTAQPVAGEGE